MNPRQRKVFAIILGAVMLLGVLAGLLAPLFA